MDDEAKPSSRPCSWGGAVHGGVAAVLTFEPSVTPSPSPRSSSRGMQRWAERLERRGRHGDCNWQAHMRGNGRLPPPRAMVAIVVLGFDEIMMFPRNPIYVFLLFVGYLLVRALAMQLDIGREFQNGMELM